MKTEFIHYKAEAHFRLKAHRETGGWTATSSQDLTGMTGEELAKLALVVAEDKILANNKGQRVSVRTETRYSHQESRWDGSTVFVEKTVEVPVEGLFEQQVRQEAAAQLRELKKLQGLQKKAEVARRQLGTEEECILSVFPVGEDRVHCTLREFFEMFRIWGVKAPILTAIQEFLDEGDPESREDLLDFAQPISVWAKFWTFPENREKNKRALYARIGWTW